MTQTSPTDFRPLPPPPWDGTVPTAIQLRAYFLSLDADDQTILAGRMVEASQTAARCWEQSHDGLAARASHLATQASRYRMAYCLARARARLWRRVAHELLAKPDGP